MSFNFDLLQKLCQAPGVSSREERVREVVVEALARVTDTISVDAMGNVIAVKNGAGGPRVMLAAHIDEIGFFVKFIDESGFLRLQPVGSWRAGAMAAQRVHVHGFAGRTLLGVMMPATKPPHLRKEGDPDRPATPEEFFVDLGIREEQVRKLVEIGDMVTMERSTERVGDTIVSRALDDRLGVFIMIEALRVAGAHQAEIVAVATAQEEVASRGAAPAAFAVEPHVGIAIDVTRGDDTLGADRHEYVTSLGSGCALKIMDTASISHPKLVRHFRDLAEQNKIPYQLEVLPLGGTDAAPIQQTRAGVPSFTLSIPTRYIHSVNEMAHCSDIEGAIELLARYIEDAHSRKYA